LNESRTTLYESVERCVYAGIIRKAGYSQAIASPFGRYVQQPSPPSEVGSTASSNIGSASPVTSDRSSQAQPQKRERKQNRQPRPDQITSAAFSTLSEEEKALLIAKNRDKKAARHALLRERHAKKQQSLSSDQLASWASSERADSAVAEPVIVPSASTQTVGNSNTEPDRLDAEIKSRAQEVTAYVGAASQSHVLASGYQEYKSHARVLLIGIGADELCAGYARHRTGSCDCAMCTCRCSSFVTRLSSLCAVHVLSLTAFRVGGPVRLQQELDRDLSRIWRRNLGAR